MSYQINDSKCFTCDFARFIFIVLNKADTKEKYSLTVGNKEYALFCSEMAGNDKCGWRRGDSHCISVFIHCLAAEKEKIRLIRYK